MKGPWEGDEGAWEGEGGGGFSLSTFRRASAPALSPPRTSMAVEMGRGRGGERCVVVPGVRAAGVGSAQAGPFPSPQPKQRMTFFFFFFLSLSLLVSLSFSVLAGGAQPLSPAATTTITP